MIKFFERRFTNFTFASFQTVLCFSLRQSYVLVFWDFVLRHFVTSFVDAANKMYREMQRQKTKIIEIKRKNCLDLGLAFSTYLDFFTAAPTFTQSDSVCTQDKIIDVGRRFCLGAYFVDNELSDMLKYGLNWRRLLFSVAMVIFCPKYPRCLNTAA